MTQELVLANGGNGMPERRGEIDELSRVLGGLQASMDTIIRVQAEDRVASAQYRTDIRRDQGELRDSVSVVKSDLLLVKSDVLLVKNKLAELEPKVLSLNERATMSAGATKFALGIGRVIHLLSAVIGGAAALLIDHWLRK
jgi:hypothetical protein